MDRWFLEYKRQSGYVHHWLVAGPQVLAAENPAAGRPQDRQQVAARHWQAESGVNEPPAELAKFTPATPEGAGAELTWRYVACGDDHLLDLAGAHPAHHYLRAWAYTEIDSPVAQKARITLHSFGPAQVWLNGEAVLQQTNFYSHLAKTEIDGEAGAATVEAPLKHGVNTLLVRLEQFAEDATPYAIALHVKGVTKDDLKVRIPTQNEFTKSHQAIERAAQEAYIERDLYADTETVIVKWPESVQGERKLMVRLLTPSGGIAGQIQPTVKGGLEQRFLEPTRSKDGPYLIRIMAPFDDFVKGLRVSHDLDVNLLHANYTGTPQGEASERALELAKHAAWWTEGIFAQSALMLLGLWKHLNEPALLRMMEGALAPGEASQTVRMGMLLMAYRYRPLPEFPPAAAQRLEECILAFDYGTAVAGEESDALMAGGAEDRAILRYAGQVLAGQLYPDRRFTHSGQLGEWLQQRGEEAATAWLLRRAKGGFAGWDSGESFEQMLLALLALVDHAASENLSELAAAVTDKLLLTLALNSYQGIFASTRGATRASSITDGRMEPTAVISRLLWGVGAWNQHMAAGVTLAASQKYGCPTLLQFIALDKAEEMLNRERHIVAWRGSADEAIPVGEINKVTYRTPDYMLASAQDYRAGETGQDEHVWQATLSPSAVVFVNHPGTLNQKPAYRPNFWSGNRILPRVAQWRDLLIALHRVPAEDWLGFTHAHFPTAHFDEYQLRRGWAFARQRDGYLALTASGGITLIKSGPGAYRELRSETPNTVWLCQMGRKAQDGDFASFQKAVLAQAPTYMIPARNEPQDRLGVTLKSLRGDAIRFGWSGPLTVNGEEQPLAGFKHYENPYTVCELGAVEMEARYEDWLLRLNFDTELDAVEE